MPVRAVRREGGETRNPALAGIGDLAHHLLAGQKSHQIDPTAREVGHGRKRDDVYVGISRDRGYRLDFGGEQRPEDQLDPGIDRRLRRRGRPRRRPLGIARHQSQLVAAGLEQRHLRGIENGTAEAGIGTRERHQQRDLGRPRRRDRGRRRRRGNRWRRRAIGWLRGDQRRRYDRRGHTGGERRQPGEGGH